MNHSSLRFQVAAALMLVVALLLQVHSRNELFPPRSPLDSLPLEIGGYIGHSYTLDRETLDILGAGDHLARDYNYGNASEPPVGLYIAYYPSQKTGDTIHSPNHCLPGGGWVPTSREIVSLRAADGSSFPANRYIVSQGGQQQIVIYWFQAHGREVASEYWAKYYMVADSIRMNRSDGALVRLTSPMLDDETPDAAQSRVMRLGTQILPLLDTYIPR